jgi:hypothetical protein
MALSASAPPFASSLTAEQKAYSLQLDDDIASVRQESRSCQLFISLIR